jgi:hypothetical protein
MVPEIPASVARDDVLAVCRKLGFDPKLLVSLDFKVGGVYATIYFTDDEGHRVSDGEDAARHCIFVPFADDEVP